MSKLYNEQVKAIVKEVERILTEEARMSQGVKIEIEMSRDEIPYISYEIREKVVREWNNCISFW